LTRTKGTNLEVTPPRPFPEIKKSKQPVLMVIASIVLIAIIGTGTVFGLQGHSCQRRLLLAAPAVNALVASTVVRCGMITVTDSNFTQSLYKGCFDTNFTVCTPATITLDNESSFA
jgi:hypothetical protein